MKDAATRDDASSAPLHAALLDYFHAPGKYQLTKRQPAVLFASIRDVLQIAAGRGAAADAQELREAALFFLRAALLYPGADHYAVLGLPPRTQPVELKERYRLLMRLIHPDYAEPESTAWPVDAAMRVNRAYEVLSSPVLRREYDDHLASARAPHAKEKGASPMSAAAPVRVAHHASARLKRKLAWTAAAAAGIGLAALVLLLSASDPVHLVQRTVAATPAPAGPPAVIEAPAAETVTRSEATAQAVAPARPAERASPPPPRRTQAPVAATPPAGPPPRLAESPVARTADAAPASPAPVQPTPPVTVAVAVMPSSPSPAQPARITRAAMGLSAPTLGEAQPMLTQLLQMLESGSGEQVLRLIEADSRKHPSALALSRQYEQLVKGGRPVRLTNVDFKGEPRDGVLYVTGRMNLHAGDTPVGSHGERFLVHAEFASRGGRVMLTGLSGGRE